MQVIYVVLIFCIVLFLYLHIYFHLKTSDDLEVYEVERPSKDKLEEICDFRQPVVFKYQCSVAALCTRQALAAVYGGFDLNVRNVVSLDPLHLPLVVTTALNKDHTKHCIIENNADFLEETALAKNFAQNDGFLRPAMVSKCIYDYQTASAQAKSPLRYEVNYRNYFLVTEGQVVVKLAPPKSSRYLFPITDYENQEFRSPVNPWCVQPQYQSECNKIKWLEVVVKQGYVLHIPAYWWYSIEFGAQPSSLCVFKYRTYMNDLAILPHTCMGILQRQNIRHKRAALYKNPVDRVPATVGMATVGMATVGMATVGSAQEAAIEMTAALDSNILPTAQQPLPAELQEPLEQSMISSQLENTVL
jgi:hypothetical protein